MRSRIAVLLALVPLSAAVRAQGSPAPVVGAPVPAPALAVTRWVKGTPVESFEPGRTYVVELFEIGESLPNVVGAMSRNAKINARGPSTPSSAGFAAFLTGVARAHPEVTVLGVCGRSAVPLDPIGEPDLAGFAAWMGDQLGFAVGLGQPTFRPWLRLPGVGRGMPQAFVVRDGMVVWHGSPMGVGEVLDADLQAAAETARRRGRAAGEAIPAATRLAEGGDVAGSVALLAKAEADLPDQAGEIGRYGVLSLPDAASEAWARELAAGERPGDRAALLGFAMAYWQNPALTARARRAMAIAQETGPDDYAAQRAATAFYRDLGDDPGERRAIARTLDLLATIPAADAERERAWMTRRLAALAKG